VDRHQLKKTNDDRNGSKGDEIGAGQFLPLWDRRADVAYEEIIMRRSS
jgi:hypothetical protein